MRALTAIFLLFPTLVFAQAETPFSQANTILVSYDSMAVDNAFTLVSRSMVYMGYSINDSNQKQLTIQTKARTFPGGFIRKPISLIIQLSFKSLAKGRTEVKLIGLFGLPDQIPATRAEYRKSKRSPFDSAFSRLQEVAQRISGLSKSQITYEAQTDQTVSK